MAPLTASAASAATPAELAASACTSATHSRATHNRPTHNAPYTLSLREIAAWQFPQLARDLPQARPAIVAAIPSLQRSAVWRPQQVELLWDSVLRGFPIGALVVSPVLAQQQSRPGRHGSGWAPEQLTHHLLDGQQRCNAIALGYLDPFAPAPAAQPSAPESDPDHILWLDLQPQAHFAANSSRAFLLRLCTSAHPWGYGSQDSDPGQQDTLSAHQVRSALHDDYHWPQQPHEAHYQRPRPKDTWPHKAGAPVPLAWLLQCAEAAHSAQDIWPALRARLEQHFALERLHAQHWARKAHALLLPAQATPCATLHDMAQALHAVAHMRIVALTVAPEALARGTRQESLRDAQIDGDSENDNNASASDQRIANVEHLFQRLNAGGTELRGDELLYSMIKAYWPGIETTIDHLPRRPPATQVALLGTRAALSSTSEGKPRGALSVSQLRAMAHPRHTRNPEQHAQERQRIAAMFALHDGPGAGAEGAEIARILQVVDGWLLYDARTNPWGLPPVLRSLMADKCSEMFFFLMLVARASLHQPIAPRHERSVRRRLLGLASAVHWFGVDAAAAVRKLWEIGPPEHWLKPQAFNGVLAALKELGHERSGIVNLRPPMGLAKIIEKPSLDTLQDWDWWHTLIAAPTDGDEDKQNQRHNSYWPLLEKLPYSEPLLMYAQRAWMAQRFGDYDPQSSDFWDGHNRPWDLDHILPQTYFTKKRNAQYMRVCQQWGNTIGNLHILRFEENRSRQDRPATDSIADAHLELAWLRDGYRDLRPAFSLEHDDVRGGSAQRAEKVLAFVCAARTRLLRMYEEWYGQLDIEAML